MPRFGMTAALSLTVVLAAGTAAAAVNVQVLRSALAFESSKAAQSALQITSPAAVAGLDSEPVVMTTKPKKASSASSPSLATRTFTVEDAAEQWQSPVSERQTPARASSDRAGSTSSASSREQAQAATRTPAAVVAKPSDEGHSSSGSAAHTATNDGRDD
ncbi:MAG: hypothetical protein WCI74_08895 [Actinomycetes bacterium]